MAKSSKKTKDAVTAESATAEPTMANGQSDMSAAAGDQATAGVPGKKATKTARKTSAPAGAKKPAAAKPRAAGASKKPTRADVTVSDDDIRLRAYFLGEMRAQRGQGGDSASDWLEARQQLLAEAAGQG